MGCAPFKRLQNERRFLAAAVAGWAGAVSNVRNGRAQRRMNALRLVFLDNFPRIPDNRLTPRRVQGHFKHQFNLDDTPGDFQFHRPLQRAGRHLAIGIANLVQSRRVQLSAMGQRVVQFGKGFASTRHNFRGDLYRRWRMAKDQVIRTFNCQRSESRCHNFFLVPLGFGRNRAFFLLFRCSEGKCCAGATGASNVARPSEADS